ncbi:MAG: hypothetical protein H6721_22330 [Sandaracinus sp.]|nr:hypothetical protein [Sandaracinus sp.]
MKHLPALLLVFSLACGGDAAPPAGRRDAGPTAQTDGALPFDDAGRDAGGRGTDPLLPPADLEVVLPYYGEEVVLDRNVEGRPGRLDVHFSIDTTGSFGGEIDALQAELRSSIIPSLEERVDDVAFGVSRFEDFPLSPFGATTDTPFELLGEISTRRADALTAVARLDQPLGHGGDGPESGFEALYQIATGDGLFANGRQWIQPYAGGGAGGVGFRDGAIRTVVHVTDAASHRADDYATTIPTAHGYTDAVGALRALGVRVLGVASHPTARADLEALANATDAIVAAEGGVCRTGLNGASMPPVGGSCPLVFDIESDGSGLTDAVVDAIIGLLDATSWREVYARADDRLGFVQSILATGATVPSGVTPPISADLRPVDGEDDTYQDVRAGTSLGFQARLRNTTVPPADYDQVFRIQLEIVGDDAILDVVTVRVIVPFGRVDAGPRDAGTDASMDTSMDGGVDAGLEDGGLQDAGLDDSGLEDAG